jgi:choline dehydrogenase-like flavoprotein
MKSLIALSRRQFWKACGRAAVGMSVLLQACATLPQRSAKETCVNPESKQDYDYVVVGSGAGGGPLACNLAKAGYRVLVLEAGGEEESYNYQVPVFHPMATEEDDMRWSFYVRHYADDAAQRRDTKYVDVADGLRRDGILYPRSGTLGGCTAHNAMIMVCPHDKDWDDIADLTGDPSWRSGRMREHFQRLERCEYVTPPILPALDSSRHGFDGWIGTTTANPLLLVQDKDLIGLVKATLAVAGRAFIRSAKDLGQSLIAPLEQHFDPNDARSLDGTFEGVCVTPLTVEEGKRVGAREYLKRVRDGCPGNLTIVTRALATRIVLDANQRATGVEYVLGPNLYRADPKSSPSGALSLPRQIASARREVIIAGGAFNTPQLLMLSGIGPPAELTRHGIPVRVALNGVGGNLQDRYEVGIVSKMQRDLAILRGATFRAPKPNEAPDPQFRDWQQGRGVYTTNGAIIAIIKRSLPAQPLPDLYLFGLAGYFKGFYPGYSKDVSREQDFFTWCVLKAHTKNSAGTVTLRSADPRDTPAINFRYFTEGNDATGDDLEAVLAGVKLVREIATQSGGLIKEEVVPGPAVNTDDDMRQFIKDNAWGHHVSCTCKIGRRDDPDAVLDSKFRVYGTQGLRVVDASVFPKIPGFFIVSAVYMISEKASVDILADARRAAA